MKLLVLDSAKLFESIRRYQPITDLSRDSESGSRVLRFSRATRVSAEGFSTMSKGNVNKARGDNCDASAPGSNEYADAANYIVTEGIYECGDARTDCCRTLSRSPTSLTTDHLIKSRKIERRCGDPLPRP